MTNEKELKQQQMPVEGEVFPLTAELPKVENGLNIQPVAQTPPSGIQPLETHKVGPQIQEALNKEKVGKDYPELGSDLTSSSVWKGYIGLKKRGAEVPS